MHERLADVGAIVGGENRFLAAVQIELGERRGVAAAAVGQIENLARLVEARGARRQRVLAADLLIFLPAALAVGLINLPAAIGGELFSQPDVVVVVGHEAGEFGVLFQQLPLAADDVDAIDVVILRVAIVEPHQDVIGDPLADADDLGGHLGNGRQVFGFLRGHVDAVDVKVLVAVGVLNVEHVLAVESPEISPDAAVLVVGNHFGRVGIVDAADIHVQHAVARGQIAELAAVGTQASRRFVGIVEQHVSRNELGGAVIGRLVGDGGRRLRGWFVVCWRLGWFVGLGGGACRGPGGCDLFRSLMARTATGH